MFSCWALVVAQLQHHRTLPDHDLHWRSPRDSNLHLVVVSLVGFEPTCIRLTFHQFRRLRVYSDMGCLNCGNEIVNEKYCSRSCAVTQNNKKPKRIAKIRNCKSCNEAITHGDRSVLCSGCIFKKASKREAIGQMTLADVAVRYNELKIAPSYRHSYVRGHCHMVNSGLQKQCQVCGYDIHVELCHVIGIASFPLTTTLNEVNDSTNIVVLCRNHHWELDHGNLTSDQIPPRSHRRDSNAWLPASEVGTLIR